MLITAISDTHKGYKQLKLTEGDILIHAGDWESYNFSSEVKDFSNWLKKQPFKHKIVIAGNHDKFAYEHNLETKEILKDSCIYLENEGIEIEGIKFWGSPITPKFGDWFFMAERGSQIKKYWDIIPKDTNVVITHGPIYGVLDQPFFYGKFEEGVGCSDLKKVLKTIKPKLHVFGHIHGSYGIKKIDGTTYINASVMNEEYEVVNEPIIYDYN